MACRLFHRPPIALDPSRFDSLSRAFISERSNLIKVLMEDAIRETGRRLRRHGSSDNIRGADAYAVAHSPELAGDMAEVWNSLQVARLHNDPRVVAANMRAARITAQLTLTFAIFPELVPGDFTDGYLRLHGSTYLDFYKARTGPKVDVPASMLTFLPLDVFIGRNTRVGENAKVDIVDLIRAKDFVAGLSDGQAVRLHSQYIQQILEPARNTSPA